MTKEELIECKNHLELLRLDIEWDFYIGYQTDLDNAIQVLEKQIPKKPIYESDHKHYGLHFCPVCKTPINYGECCHNNDCRQAIDWSEE